MIKKILIPLDASPYTDSAFEYGCQLAKGNDAEITGLAVLDVPGIEKSIGSVPIGGIYFSQNLVEAKKQEELDRIMELVSKFEAKCKEEKVRYSVAECQGSPSDQIIHESMYYDLVIIGLRTYYQTKELNIEGESIEKILDSTITPIIAVPEKITSIPSKGGDFRVLVAFNESPPSVRALHRFAQRGCGENYQVKILMSGDEEKESREALKKAQQFLFAHGFSNIDTEWTSQPVIDTVKERYMDWPDEIVLGIHSKHGLVDFMIGSLSRFLIKNGTKLLLLGQ